MKIVGFTTDKKEIYEGDYLTAIPQGRRNTITGQVQFSIEYGVYGIMDKGKLAGSSGSSTTYKPYTWKSYKLIYHYIHL